MVLLPISWLNPVLDHLHINTLKEALKIKKKVSKRKLKKKAEVAGNKAVIKDTGEVIKGVKIVDRPEKFKVEVND